MTSKKVNIKAGDIGETDEENEKLIEKLEKKSTRKPKVARRPTKVIVLDMPDQITSYQENHQPGQPLPEDAAERAANGSGWQGEEVVDVPVKQQKTKKQTAKPAAKKPAKEKSVNPHVHDTFVNARGVTMKATKEWKPATKLTRENAILLVSLKEQNAKLAEMAEAIGTSTGYINWVLYKGWRRDVTQDLFPDFANTDEAKAYWKQRQKAYKAAHE